MRSSRKSALTSCIDQYVANDMERELRNLALMFVESATIVERVPELRSTWLRAEVVWTKPLQVLIDAEQVIVGPNVESPEHLTSKQLHALAMRRYMARKRAGLVAKK